MDIEEDGRYHAALDSHLRPYIAPGHVVQLRPTLADSTRRFRVAAVSPDAVTLRSRDAQEIIAWAQLLRDIRILRSGPGKTLDIAPERGVLSQLGYRVGASGHPLVNRRAALLQAYVAPHSQVLRLVGPAFAADWGKPDSIERLLKIARCLEAFSRNNEGKAAGYSPLAVDDWRRDLNWLDRELYESWATAYRREGLPPPDWPGAHLRWVGL